MPTKLATRILTLALILLFSATAWAAPWVVAHRGGALGPENRLATFKKAIALGVDAIELDIHQTRDGHLVVIHDDTLTRTFPGQRGRIEEMTLAQLKAAGLPTLEQALDLARGRCRVFVEIKHPSNHRYEGIEERLVEVLRATKMADQVVVISFDAESLRRLHRLAPALPTGYLTKLSTTPDEANAIGATYLAPHYKGVDAAYVRAVHAAGLKVSVWTVDNADAMKSMVEAGCDAITTNEPERALDILGRVKTAR